MRPQYRVPTIASVPLLAFLVFLLSFAVHVTDVQSQPTDALPETTNSVLEQYYERIGGLQAISKVSDLRITGSFLAKGEGEKAWQIDGTFEELRTADLHRLSVFYYADTLLALIRSPSLKGVDQPGLSDYVFMENDRTQAESPIPFTNVHVDPEHHLRKDREAYAVEIWDADSTKWQVLFDAQTFLPIRAVKHKFIPFFGKEAAFAYDYDDFRDVLGVTMPYRVKKTVEGLGSVTYLVERYDLVNPPFNRDLFRFGEYKNLLTSYR